MTSVLDVASSSSTQGRQGSSMLSEHAEPVRLGVRNGVGRSLELVHVVQVERALVRDERQFRTDNMAVEVTDTVEVVTEAEFGTFDATGAAQPVARAVTSWEVGVLERRGRVVLDDVGGHSSTTQCPLGQ